MNSFVENFYWIPINVALAFLGVLFGFLLLNVKTLSLKVLFFILWILFLPNTIYLITDIQYFPEQFINSEITTKLGLLLQYIFVIITGIVTFILGLRPLEKIFKKNATSVIVIANFLIAFGVALGKLQRTHSWYVFTDPQMVIYDSQTILNSTPSLFFIILFAILINFIYFYFRKLHFR